MDDLNDLIWGSGSNKSQKNNNTSLNAMRGTEPTLPKKQTTLSTSPIKQTTTSNSSNQNIFLSQAMNTNSPVFKRFNNNNSDSNTSNQNFESSTTTSGKNFYSSNYNKSPSISPNLTPTSNGNSVESLDNLLSFNKKSPNLSLAEKVKLQEQEQKRKLQVEQEKLKEHYNQSHFWDSLEGTSSGNGLNTQQTGDIFDEILSGTNQYGNSESNNQIRAQTVSETQWDLDLLSNDSTKNKAQNTTYSTTNDLMDFGIFERQDKSSSPVPDLDVEDDSEDDDENPLGELAKPVSTKRDASPHNEKNLSSSPTSRNESKDHLIAQIVDMGFSADDAEAALAVTNNGKNVSSAIEILVQQREVVDNIDNIQTSKCESQQPYSKGRRRSNTADGSEHGYNGRERFSSKNNTLNVPRRNVYGINASDGESSDLSSSSVSSNFLQQKEKLISTASEFGMHAFKKASAFYKQSKEVVNKAIEDLQHDTEENNSNKPRWMQNYYFQSDDDSSDHKFEEKFQDSYDDSSSDDDYHRPATGRNRFVSVSSHAKDSSEDDLPTPGRNKFIPVSSKLRDSSDDDILPGRDKFVSKSSRLRENTDEHCRSVYQNESKKPPKPVVPSRSTKPDTDTYKSVHRRPTSNNNSQKKPVREYLPTHITPSKPPRPMVHVSPEQLNNSEAHKTKGNELFKLGQFGEAEKYYSLAIDSLPYKHLLRVIIYNNRAATRLKNGDHRGCVGDCTIVLELIDDYTLPPPTGVTINLKDQYNKALLRRASAYETMEKYDSAKDDYQTLINTDPGIGKNVNDGLRRCQKAIKMMTDGGNSEIKEENVFPSTSLNQSSNQYEFAPSATPVQSASQSTFGAPLNAFGFIDPTAPAPTTSTYVDPNNPAVAKLRDQARQQEFEDAEKLRLKDQVDQKLIQWKGGKETNLRALISSLDIILWDGLGWKTIGLHELVTPSQVKVRYMKAISKLHPDKLSSSTTIEQRLIANGVFSTLNDAWDIFKTQNNL